MTDLEKMTRERLIVLLQRAVRIIELEEWESNIIEWLNDDARWTDDGGDGS